MFLNTTLIIDNNWSKKICKTYVFIVFKKKLNIYTITYQDNKHSINQ